MRHEILRNPGEYKVESLINHNLKAEGEKYIGTNTGKGLGVIHRNGAGRMGSRDERPKPDHRVGDISNEEGRESGDIMEELPGKERELSLWPHDIVHPWITVADKAEPSQSQAACAQRKLEAGILEIKVQGDPIVGFNISLPIYDKRRVNKEEHKREGIITNVVHPCSSSM